MSQEKAKQPEYRAELKLAAVQRVLAGESVSAVAQELGNRRYRRGSFDFLAAYVVLEDCWYIIPEGIIVGKERLSLSSDSARAHYEEYREAWRLMRGPKANSRIDRIQACAEEVGDEMDMLASVEPESACDASSMAVILSCAVRALGENCLYGV